MRAAVDSIKNICAHPALKAELEVAWPGAHFVFSDSGREIPGMMEDYDAGKCEVMALGVTDTTKDAQEMMCERNLVYTSSLIIENPIAFPIRKGLASGFSYWMYQGEKYNGVSIPNSEEEASSASVLERLSCGSVEFSVEEESESNDYEQITPRNMFFPFIFYLAFAFLAIILQLFHQRNTKQGRRGIYGRNSSLTLMSNRKKELKNYRTKKESEDEEQSILEENKQIEKSIESDYSLRLEEVEHDDFCENGTSPARRGTVDTDNSVGLKAL